MRWRAPLPLAGLGQIAQPRELLGTDGPVLPEEGALLSRARVEAHDDGVRLVDAALPRAARLELEPGARRHLPPARALGLVGGARPGAAGDGEEVEVVVARDGEETPLLAPAGEGRLDELPALAVVGAVAGDDDRVDALLVDRARGAQEAQVRVVRRRLQHLREGALAGRGDGQRRWRGEPRGGTPWRRRARPDRAAPRSRARSGRGARSRRGRRARRRPSSCSGRAARASPPPPSRARSALRSRRPGARALDELRAVVQRVAERRDVEVRDVGEGEGHLHRVVACSRVARREGGGPAAGPMRARIMGMRFTCR